MSFLLRPSALLPRAAFASLLTCTALTLAAPAAHAQTVYIGLDDPRGTLTNSTAARDSFLAALTTSGTDDIEAFADGTGDPTLTFGTTGITATTDVYYVVRTDYDNPFIATSGTNSLLDRVGDDRFTLSNLVNAFGLTIIGARNSAAPSVVTLRLQNTIAGTSKDVSYTYSSQTTDRNVLFFGVTDSDAFNQVLYLNSRDATDGAFFDDVTVGPAAPAAVVAAPEPGTIALLLSAGVPLVGIIRRRKSAQ